MDVGIVSYGAYIPKYRITPNEIGRVWGADGIAMGKGLYINMKSVPSPDEDVVTISVEAARNMMSRVDIEGAEIGAPILLSQGIKVLPDRIIRMSSIWRCPIWISMASKGLLFRSAL